MNTKKKIDKIGAISWQKFLVNHQHICIFIELCHGNGKNIFHKSCTLEKVSLTRDRILISNI